MWSRLPLELHDPHFLKVQPYIITNLNLVWKRIIIMSLHIRVMCFMKIIINLLLDMKDTFIKLNCCLCLCLRIDESSCLDAIGKATTIGANGYNLGRC